VPGFRHRLTRPQQRVYDRSDAIASVPLRATARLRQAVALLPAMLQSADRRRVEACAQLICDEITTILRIPAVHIAVNGTRPSNARGELHGLYTPRPSGAGRSATITVWMITAKRGQVVAFKTFLRTLLHEICHHLDYALLGLPDSFHTDGFYKRESSLFYQIGAEAPGSMRATGRPGAGPAAMLD